MWAGLQVLSAQGAAAQGSQLWIPKHMESSCSEGSCSELGTQGLHSSPLRPPDSRQCYWSAASTAPVTLQWSLNTGLTELGPTSWG